MMTALPQKDLNYFRYNVEGVQQDYGCGNNQSNLIGSLGGFRGKFDGNVNFQTSHHFPKANQINRIPKPIIATPTALLSQNINLGVTNWDSFFAIYALIKSIEKTVKRVAL